MTDTVFRQRSKPPKPGRSSGRVEAAKPAKPPKAAKGPKPAKALKPARSSKKTESPSLVDPRLQARRLEVARGEGRRRLRWVMAAVVIAVLVGGAYALAQSPVLDVDHVEVRGTSRTERAEAVEAAGIASGSAMVGVDAPAVEGRLEALPWVERATVSRSWPGTVEIAVVERTPVAVVGTGSDAVQVDGDGRVLGPVTDTDLPVLGGDGAVAGRSLSPTQRWVVAAVADLPDDLRSEVAAASATPAGIRLTLHDGIDVRWGDSRQSTAKADAVRVLLDQADRTTIDTIDVSVPRAATVTRS
ncbi:MAG: ftsQ [Ilumatobacteraceae bacterium]|nr:ftsQ [Ilumatobacteraceae bacterium]